MTARRWLILIVAGGALLRLFPFWWGLPPLNHPDEGVSTRITQQILDGKPNPEFFHWGSLTFYVLAAAQLVVGILKALSGYAAGVSSPEQYILGRGVIALAGTATLVVLFVLARRVAGEKTALIASALLAVAVLHVRESHFAMTDVMATFLATSSLALLIRAIDERDPRPALRVYTAAGFVAGLATSTKYHTAAVAAAMAAAQFLLLRDSPGSIRRLRTWMPSIAFACAQIFGFVVGTPYSVLDYPTFAFGVREIFNFSMTGNAIDLGRGWSYHPRYSLPFGMGVTAYLAALGGLVVLLRHQARHGIVLVSFVFALYGLVGSGRNLFFRYILPTVPILCLAAAVFVRHSAAWLATRVRMPERQILAALVLVVLAPGLIASVWLDVLLARSDTRVIAKQWLVTQLRPDDSLFDAGDASYGSIDLSGVPVRRFAYDVPAKSFQPPSDETPKWLVLLESPLVMYGYSPHAVRDLARSDYEEVFVVRGAKDKSPWAIYDEHDAFFLPLWGFWTVERPGPTIRIYRKKGDTQLNAK